MLIWRHRPGAAHLRKTIGSFAVIATLAAGAGTMGLGLNERQAHARTACSAASKAPDISVRIRPGTVVVDNARGQDGLKRIQGQAARRARGWSPVGLTSTELGFSMNVRINAVPAGRGTYCGYLDTVNASFGYDKLTVYVARKYRPGSCHHASIMEHEKTHVLVFRRVLDQYAPRLERRLTTAAYRLPPIVAASANQVASQIKDRLRREVQPLFREMNRELDRANAKLDTPENYKQEQARCDGW